MEPVRLIRRAACALAIAFVAAPAAAQEVPMHVYEEGQTSIRLMRGPCEHVPILGFFAQSAPQYVERLRAIESTWPHKDGSLHEYAGCWLELDAAEGGGEELFVLLFSDGHRFVVRKEEFLRGAGTGA